MNTLFQIDKKTGKDEWLTPPGIIQSLGEFDLDPCSPINRPWDTAKNHLNINDNGLLQKWDGRIWLNPPYGDQSQLWLKKLANHGDGIALIFARTGTKWFFDHVWNKADAVFFFLKRIHFYHVNGERGGSPGADSCLIAYGSENVEAIQRSSLKGKLIIL